MGNISLQAAKTQKLDEFYTQLADIEKELRNYREQLKDKIIFCNCDDPYESNFFRYFALNFNRLGLKQLITTSYMPSPIANTQLGLFGDDRVLGAPKGRPKITANKFIINQVDDIDDNGAFDLRDIAEQLKANKNNEWTPLAANGDFRSSESIELLKRSDIVVTNPPFSLFKEFVGQLVAYNKQFLIIGNTNAITYKEIFKLIKENKFRTGYTNFNVGMFFEVPDNWERFHHIDEKSNKKIARVSTSCWFTNLDVAKHHEFIPLYKKYNPEDYPKYDNYDAIEVGTYKDIPIDYNAAMGVPITFLDKYNPDQFEILGMCENKDLYGLKTKFYTTRQCQEAYFAKFGRRGTYDLNASGVVIKSGLLEKVYQRILIKIKDSKS